MKHGKDGRKLSSFQSKSWMKKIEKFRKYKNQPKGEKNWNAKINSNAVIWIRSIHGPISKKFANEIARMIGICSGYVYHLRSKNPRVRKWKHLDLI